MEHNQPSSSCIFLDKFLCQYPDHPALIQAQQPFTQILSDALAAHQPCSSDELSTVQASAPAPYYSSHIDTPAAAAAQGNNTEDPAPAFSLNVMATDTVEPSSSLPAESSSCCMDVVSMAFFKGMEEASKFLPSDGVAAGSGRGQKKRLDVDDVDEAEAGTGRSSKQMAADGQESEEAAAREMLNQLMLNGCEPSAADMEELRSAMEMEKTPRPRGSRGTSAVGQAVDLHTMLIRCAEAVAADDRRGVADLLERIRRHSSPAGDGTQRLAHYFALGLEARMAGTGSRLYRSIMVRRSSLADYLKACQLHMTACCFLPVSFLFCSETICSAVAGRKKLHIVCYGLNHGLQWPDVLRRLGNREGGPPEVKLTGIDAPLPGFRPAQVIEETGRRLSESARRFGVPFKFRGIAAKSEDVLAGDLGIDPDEVLVVASTFHFRSLMDEGVAVAVAVDGRSTNPIDTVLNTIREMRPAVFIHAIVNASYSAAFFLTRFREMLYSFTAQFDMLDTVVPRDSDRRLVFERDVLARCAANVVACEGADRVLRPRSYKQWQARSQRAGLRQLPLDRGVVQMLKDKVRKEYHRCFEVSEDQHWLLQGWKGRVLCALSTWTAGDDPV
ncbi:scarecrow-like protein 33 [Panicum miliaceum]|uniref:Scarecrow-like protein 33 n=1 Tax=Panicum miliaceum TaxID=4540 RepID=A0A3L6Q4T2_PANMI|nr:scarecrow-like protein 33 [Panicum miliaceum]